MRFSPRAEARSPADSSDSAVFLSPSRLPRKSAEESAAAAPACVARTEVRRLAVYLMLYCGAFDAAGVSADFEEKAGFAAGIVRRFWRRAAFGKKAEILYGLRGARVFEMPEAGVICGVLQ